MPYRLPARLDLARLQSLLVAKRASTEDHIWSLRKDPGYFADNILEMKEHRVDFLGEGNRQRRPSPGARNRVLQALVHESHSMLFVWDDLVSRIAQLQLLMEKHAAEITPEKHLPTELLEALLKLRTSLIVNANGPISYLKQDALAPPPLHSCFHYLSDYNPATDTPRPKSRAGPAFKGERYLLWILMTLWDTRSVLRVGLPTVADELERLIESDPAVKRLISSRVANIISDLSLIAECQSQIALYQPWAGSFMHESIARRQVLDADDTTSANVINGLRDAIEPVSLTGLGDPSGNRFYYPVDKRQTPQNTSAMQEAERNLDQF